MPGQNANRNRGDVLRRLHIAAGLYVVFICVQVTGGLLSHSLAVLSDAGHSVSDLLNILVAIAASYLASRPGTQRYTFGLERAESFAALISMILLVFLSIGLMWGAIHRLINIRSSDTVVDGRAMAVVGTIALFTNGILIYVLGEEGHVHMPGESHKHFGYECVACEPVDEEKEPMICATTPRKFKFAPMEIETKVETKAKELQKKNVNLRAAYLHVLGDLMLNVAVLITGIVIWFKPEWHIIDPILTLFFSIWVLSLTFVVLRSSTSVLLEAIPPDINWQEVYDDICAVPNVTHVHDLHIWSISHGKAALSVHCVSGDPRALRNINAVCADHGIHHSTIQVQAGGNSKNPVCPTCDPSQFSCYGLEPATESSQSKNNDIV